MSPIDLQILIALSPRRDSPLYALIRCARWKYPIGHHSATKNYLNTGFPNLACALRGLHSNRSSDSSTTSFRRMGWLFIHPFTLEMNGSSLSAFRPSLYRFFSFTTDFAHSSGQ